MAGFDTVRMLLIDNYDSFTYNVVQAFAALGADVSVHRNDAITVAAALELDPTHLVISPGPGRPEDAGVSLAMIAAFAERVPVLGICLGHQSLVHHNMTARQFSKVCHSRLKLGAIIPYVRCASLCPMCSN